MEKPRDEPDGEHSTNLKLVTWGTSMGNNCQLEQNFLTNFMLAACGTIVSWNGLFNSHL